jgi:exopolysaccharide biosynthesis polyprenyl glycosylphosphotransferase
VIAVCQPSALHELMSTLDRLAHVGYQVVGTCVPEVDSRRDLDLPVPCYGGVDDVVTACEEAGADLVIVGGGGYSTSQALRRIGWALEGRRIDLLVVPGLVDVAGPRIHMRHLSGLPLVHIEEPQVSRAGGLAKRAFDVAVAGLALVVISPLMLAIALGIKLQDRGPVLYRQERSGRNGTPFTMTKFRSMVVGADRRLAEVADFNDVDDVLFKMRRDPRVTWLGRFLRRFSLDELPQLVDVLRGQMSLVGPRPPLPAEVELYPADMHRRLLVRPGLTGLWQVSGRSDLSFDEAVRMDLYYVDNWSITGDLIILLKTARAVLLGQGAY